MNLGFVKLHLMTSLFWSFSVWLIILMYESNLFEIYKCMTTWNIRKTFVPYGIYSILETWNIVTELIFAKRTTKSRGNSGQDMQDILYSVYRRTKATQFEMGQQCYLRWRYLALNIGGGITACFGQKTLFLDTFWIFSYNSVLNM